MSTRSTALVDIADALDLIAEADRLDQAPSVGQRAFDAVLEQRSHGGLERAFEVGIRAVTSANTPQLLSTLQPQMPTAVQRRLFVHYDAATRRLPITRAMPSRALPACPRRAR